MKTDIEIWFSPNSSLCGSAHLRPNFKNEEMAAIFVKMLSCKEV